MPLPTRQRGSLASSRSDPQPSSVDDATAFRVFIISDTHVKAAVDGDPNAEGATRESDKRYYYTAGAKLRQFVNAVNAEQPDLVLHLGDVTDAADEDSFTLFQSIWGDLDPSIPAYVIPGNHDLVEGYEAMVAGLALGERDETAGSKGNFATEVTGANGETIKLILVDTNLDANGDPHVTSVGVLPGVEREWLYEELVTSETDKVLVALHHGPYSRIYENRYFQFASAWEYVDIVGSAKLARPGLHVITLFGHSHPTQVRAFQELAVPVGINLPAAVLNKSSYFTELAWAVDSRDFGLTDHPIGAAIHDSFTDTDGTSLTAHTPDINVSERPWVHHASSNGLEVRSNRAQNKVVSGSFLTEFATVTLDTPASTIRATIFSAPSNGAYHAGLVFRHVDDSNYWIVYVSAAGNVLTLREVTGGSSTVRATDSGYASQEYTMEVRDDGETIEVLVDGETVATVESTTHATGTGVGVYVRSSNSYVDDFMALP